MMTCIICLGIVNDPYECSHPKCNVVFCNHCIQQHQQNALPSSKFKCPSHLCRKQLQISKINRVLSSIALEKMKFEHVCIKCDDLDFQTKLVSKRQSKINAKQEIQNNKINQINSKADS